MNKTSIENLEPHSVEVEEDKEPKSLEENKENSKEEGTSSTKVESKPVQKIFHLNKKFKTFNQIGKSIKSGTSSFTNDSSLNNDPLSSSRDSGDKKKKSFDIEYPTLKRCHSTKKYHYSKDYKDIIKEEKYEDEGDSFCSFISNKSKFSSYTIMPRDNLYFLDKKKLFDENTIKAISTMEPVPETFDENLIFQKKKIQILSDRKEDSKLNVTPNSTLNIKKAPLDENEIIEEVKELDGIFDEEFDQKLDSIKIKYKSFYDKEEPPIIFSGLQGECKPFIDEIPDVVTEADFEDDAKEVIRKNSMIIQRKKNIADEVDDDFKISKLKRINSKFHEIKDTKLIDENDELVNKEDNENENEEKEDKEDNGSDKGSKKSNDSKE